MSEYETRRLIERIDELRADSTLCTQMALYWGDHELVEVEEVTVRRRWRSDKTIHSERVMSAAERNIFRDWLHVRARERADEASALTNQLEGVI